MENHEENAGAPKKEGNECQLDEMMHLLIEIERKKAVAKYMAVETLRLQSLRLHWTKQKAVADLIKNELTRLECRSSLIHGEIRMLNENLERLGMGEKHGKP